MATYLVTGAAGFIASKVCELLLADEHTVVGIDNLNDYYDVRLKDWRLMQLLDKSDMLLGADPKRSIFSHHNEPLTNSCGKFVFRYLDIENLNVLDSLFAEFKFDAVFNLAARAGVRYSLVNPHVYMKTNALGTLNLLECQRQFGVKKHVLASTSSLYAGCPLPFTEDQPVNTPLSPYAASKKSAEALCYTYHKQFELDVTVLRYFTVYGPAGRPDMAPFRFVKWIAEGKALTVYGDGRQTRDFTYVDDIARGTVMAVKQLGHEVINLGGGNTPITLQSMIDRLERLLGKKAVIDRQPAQAVDMQDTSADLTKARALLGWQAATPPQVGFRLISEWYRINEQWLKAIEV